MESPGIQINLTEEKWKGFERKVLEIFGSLDLSKASRDEILDKYLNDVLLLIINKFNLGLDETAKAAKNISKLKKAHVITYPKMTIEELHREYDVNEDGNIAFDMRSFLEITEQVMEKEDIRELQELDLTKLGEAVASYSDDEDEVFRRELEEAIRIPETGVFDMPDNIDIHTDEANEKVIDELAKDIVVSDDSIKKFCFYYKRIRKSLKFSDERNHAVLENWLNEHVMQYYNAHLMNDDTMQRIIDVASELDEPLDDSVQELDVADELLHWVFDSILDDDPIFQLKALVNIVLETQEKNDAYSDPLANGTEVLVKDLFEIGSVTPCIITGVLPLRFTEPGKYCYVVEPIKPRGEYRSYVTERFNIVIKKEGN